MYVYALLRGGGGVIKKTLLLSGYGSDPHPSAPIEDKKLKLHFFSPFFINIPIEREGSEMENLYKKNRVVPDLPTLVYQKFLW